MNGTTNKKIVTGPVGLGPHKASWIGASSPAVPISTMQGRAKWKPHTLDKGHRPDYRTTAMPEQKDKLQKRAPLSHRIRRQLMHVREEQVTLLLAKFPHLLLPS
ncbi:unnamed protein product [Macrosiphum euphorbiae]|uniref:Uncharacterized protein n=1 Tax=Macrosiphum euphorbiae TaxID=13131 RepID=A0AAV0XRF5_9HEMI|nr:unnamed protein product [Macrosiphum euphorbiae]